MILDLEMVRKGNISRFGKHLSEEEKKLISEATKKGMSNPEVRKRMSESHKGRHLPPKTEFKKGFTPWIKGKEHSKESKRKMSLANKGRLPWNTGKTHSEETKRKISLAHKGKPTWNKGKTGIYSEETKRKIGMAGKGRHPSEETKRKRRNIWDKPEYRKLRREIRAKQIFPLKDSNPEIKIQNFLQQLNIIFLKHKHIKEIEHSYQCDIFIPSMNLIIECDGNYWHKYPIGREIDNIRTKEIIEKGFKVLRLWESDIKKMNLNDFKDKIKSFEK